MLAAVRSRECKYGMPVHTSASLRVGLLSITAASVGLLIRSAYLWSVSQPSAVHERHLFGRSLGAVAITAYQNFTKHDRLTYCQTKSGSHTIKHRRWYISQLQTRRCQEPYSSSIAHTEF